MKLAAIALVGILSTSAAAGPPLPAHYAELFDEGRRWTYDVKVTTWDHAKMENLDTQRVPMKPWPRRVEKHVVTCRVAKVAQLGSARVAEVTCDKEVDRKLDVPGIYVATAAGLHRYGGTFPQSESDVADLDPPLIAAKPKAMRETTNEPFAGNDTYRLTRTVKRGGAAWCTSQRFDGAAHDGTRSMCFGGVITRGGDDIAGELHDVQYRARASR